MNLSTLDNILHHHLAPWRQENKIMDKFKVKLHELPDKSFNTFYDVEYLPPTNEKHKFYLRTIKNTIYEYLEAFITIFNTASNAEHKAYLLNKSINSILQYFKNTQEVIEQRAYNFDEINNLKNREIRDEIYIIHLIKNYLIALYLEIKEVTHEQVSYAFLDEAGIQAEFFHSYDFKSFINEVPEALKQEVKTEHFKQSKKVKFTPLPHDFRDEKKGVLKYDEIVNNPTHFNKIEELLFENGYITEDYIFIPNKANSHTEKFALIFLGIIQKGYLRKSNLGKPIKSIQYRKFIEYRYIVDIDRQFRNFEHQPNKIQQFIEEHRWLSNLPKF